MGCIFMREQKCETWGVTPQSDYPNCCPHESIEICETDVIKTTGHDPLIGKVISVNVSVSLEEIKPICTPLGWKLIVNFCKHITVIFKAANCLETKHTILNTVPACLLIPLGGEYCKVKTVRIFIEHIHVCLINDKSIGVSTVIAAVPIFANSHTCDEDNSVRCDIKIRGSSDTPKMVTSAIMKDNELKI